ncbi:conserved protein of unknown function [Lactobacillus delbrueckii subsp. delbrueckii]|uniref:Uncharacterized protein n=1 Tax=Lactobacillus delbrueckii subsp. delbrueckii TaxID=83684 RepID=A0AAU9QZ30_9LACO|nr:hypothetical protein [Lactobacillus delbrueckii]CAH1705415.1 conserved protein of unknown function [Lactobacillus delbrueckii subsp. delbrueckii]
MSHKHDPNFNSKLNGKEKFGFRKLSIDLVAVALDTSFFVGSEQLVHAADDTATETVVQQGNASDSSSADTSYSTTVEESTSSESTTETAPAEKTNSKSTTEGTAPPADEQKQAAVTSRLLNQQKQAAVTSRLLNQQKPARRLRKPASRKRM